MNKESQGHRLWRSALLVMLSGGLPLHAALVDQQKELPMYFKRDLTSAQFSAEYQNLSGKNYLMTDFDAYSTADGTRYSMLWQKNTDSRAWAILRDMDSATIATEIATRRNQGFRLVDVEAYPLNGAIRWGAIWVKNNENYLTIVQRSQTSADFSQNYQTNTNAGYRLVDFSAYNTANGVRYNGLWQKNADGRQWIVLRDMSRQQYQNNMDAYYSQGFDLVDFEAYDSPYGTSYAGIWEKRSTLSSAVKSDRDAQAFTNLFYEQADKGYRLVDFERYVTDDGVRYAGVWQENNARFRYSKKDEIDDAIVNYRDTNNLPGISVVMIRDGDMFYRRGFGWADVDSKKAANSQTIYSWASLSKVLAGTLAAKLEDKGSLEDGTTFTLDLDERADTYIPTLPGGHNYTTAQLLSHLGCIQHYPTGFAGSTGIPDQTTHYNSALAALSSITGQNLVSPCTIGTSYNYSTHAFTIVGAVLERQTGKGISDLVRSEISEPYGLTTLRAQYETANLPSNYFRATPYDEAFAIGTPGTSNFKPPHPQTNPNVETNYTDSSWKVLGGGLESSTYDLARFGWKTLNGEIVSASDENNVRDDRLWTRVNNSNIAARHGLGWQVINANSGRRIADWSGGWLGARTYLRAYRDNGLVIAIMSNRRNHRSDINADVFDLADSLENIVLGPPRANF